ncbi:thioredoxin-dependent peroxiredoxin [Frankia sp. AiPs1]|uniref:peroxiredoxin-like family protein n=1 Tax=Frankia sp. AiPa1 TaxID=573492 RepID=UPI00202B75D5|nr:peroxiredoxin-like family protein [Frankia sp. AiPa1]MCL9758978.1 AhpC/TSA family protein [Frankia sp. AiPa1]
MSVFTSAPLERTPVTGTAGGSKGNNLVSQTRTAPRTVGDFMSELQATRDAQWPPEQLRAHAERRHLLVTQADPARFVAVGDVVAPFALPTAGGGTTRLADLLTRGPAVLLFFRFESCPACNTALRAYQATLAPALRKLGATLAAISPQVSTLLSRVQERHGLDFVVASDPGHALIDRFGIGFAPTPTEREASRQQGIDLGEILGTGEWVLPYPTAVVIDQNRTVRFADVQPNWMVRAESADILAAVRGLRAEGPSITTPRTTPLADQASAATEGR